MQAAVYASCTSRARLLLAAGNAAPAMLAKSETLSMLDATGLSCTARERWFFYLMTVL
jgi:hypothetical protein